MRRTLTTLTAFLTVTSGLLVLPVYAAPAPDAAPVDISISEVKLGSVTAPEDDAVVTTDGDPLAGAVSEAEAAATPTTPEPAPVNPEPAPVNPEPATEGTAAAGRPTDMEGDQDGIASSGDELAGVPALTVSQPDTKKFSTVGVTWRQKGLTDVVVQLRVKDLAGQWGAWTTLEADDVEQTATKKTAGQDVRGGTAPYWTGDARGIEVIVQGSDGVPPAGVELALVDPGESAADELPMTSGVQDQAQASAAMPPIISRAQWGADESIRSWDPEYAPTIKAATLHHTTDRNTYTAADVPGMLRSIYAYHAVTRGWGDIGYNVIVDKFGRAFEGRYGGLASTVMGAHAGGFNTGTFGVSMLGNYAEAAPPQAMVDKVAAVVGWKLALYGVDPRAWTTLTSAGGGTSRYAAGTSVAVPTVFGHRDVGRTTCPGIYGYGKLDEIRAKAYSAYVQRSTTDGVLDAVTPSFGRATVSGWALDLDAPKEAVTVHAYVDGVYRSAYTANGSRPDLKARFPTAGAAHGYDFALDMTRGRHRVCVYALNLGAGSENPLLGCRTVDVAGFQPDPIGVLDRVSALGDRIGLTGWTLDGSSPTQPVSVHVYLDGRYVESFTANGSRRDIAGLYPGAGETHGFSGAVSATPGSHEVCVYALNVGTGTANPLLGCANVTVGSAVHAPVGSFDAVSVAGVGARVSGWTLDPDDPATPGSVHVYVDGRYDRQVTADVARPDVVAEYPALGVNAGPGFSTILSVEPGPHVVCVYAIDQGAGTDNPFLGCRSIDVPAEAWNPVGVIDSASVTGITANLRGWAFDPDTPAAPSEIHVYVDGVLRRAVPADGYRPDVGAAFGVGDAHGLSMKVSIEAGTHTVCAYAINTGRGTTHPFLGCKTVTVAASAWAAYGSLDTSTVSNGQLQVRGWAVDPDDQGRTLSVAVQVNGEPTVLTADASRPDVETVYPGAGPLHGFEAALPLPAGGGPYTVCAYAVAVGDGETDVPLGCRTAN